MQIVHRGYWIDNLPASLQFLGWMYDKIPLIKLAYGYELGTMKRKPFELK
jgi:hypothetical protein